MIDIVVVGGGPAGCHVAGMLAASGYVVKVLEKQPGPGVAHCCTGIVGRECYERVPGAAASVLRPAQSASFFSPSGKEIRLEKTRVQAYVLDRARFDRAMVAHATERGAEFLYGCHVQDARAVDGHMEVDALHDGQRLVTRSKCLVLASGFSPALTARLGLGRVGDFAVGAQVEVEARGVEEVQIYLSRHVAPGFFAWVTPTTADRVLVGLITRRRPGEYLARFLRRLRQEGKISGEAGPVRYGRIPLKPLRRSYGHRLVAVGDAAGQVKPTTGGGIYYGVLCGDIAADVLCRGLRSGDLSARSLSEYESRWRRKLARELRMGYLSRLLFERLGDEDIDALFDVVRTWSLDREVLDLQGFSFDWHGDILRHALRHRAVRRVVRSLLKDLLIHREARTLISPRDLANAAEAG